MRRAWDALSLSRREADGLVGALVLIIAITLDVAAGGLLPTFDIVVRDGLRGLGPDSLIHSVADVGSLGVSGAVAIIAGLMCAHGLWRLWPAILVTCHLAALVLVVGGLKLAVGRGSPSGQQPTWGEGGAYPSGHTATAAVCVGTAAFLLAVMMRPGPGSATPTERRRRWRTATVVGTLVGVVAGVAVGVAVIVTGYHWFSDVAASLLLSVVILRVGFAAAYAAVLLQETVISPGAD